LGFGETEILPSDESSNLRTWSASAPLGFGETEILGAVGLILPTAKEFRDVAQPGSAPDWGEVDPPLSALSRSTFF
jgi:hypothetical protein